MTFPMMKKMKLGLRFAVLCVAMAMTAGCTGCSPAWWQKVQSDPAAAVSQLVDYVQTFLTGAETLWSTIVPFIPASAAPQAKGVFTNAVATLNGALAVLQDGVRAAAATQQATPDFSALISNVQDAVQRVLAIIAQYQSSPDAGVGAGASYAQVSHQAQVIAAWKN